MTREEFIEKARNVHGDTYNYNRVVYVNSQTKVLIICPQGHQFWQIPNSHLRGCRCSACFRSTLKTTEVFKAQAINIHGNKFNYDKVNYVNAKTKIIVTCEKGHDFKIIPNDHLAGSGCGICFGKYLKEDDGFIKRAIETFGEKYDYSKTEYKGNKFEITIICKEHKEEFTQFPSNHIKGHIGCEYCLNVEHAIEFINKSKVKHKNKYNYDKVKYKNSRTRVEIICDIHGSFWQKPQLHLFGSGCSKCGRKSSGEKNTKSREIFIQQCEKKYPGAFDYEKVVYVHNKKHITITCKIHGIDIITKPRNLINIFVRCQQCVLETRLEKEVMTTDLFKDKIKKKYPQIYEKNDYTKSEYTCMRNKVMIRCIDHDNFYTQLPFSALNGRTGCNLCKTCPICQMYQTFGKICNICNTVYHKSKEMRVVKFLMDSLPNHEFIYNKSVGKLCTDRGTHRFPDILYKCLRFDLIVEVDEYKHLGSNYKCEKKRMYEIHTLSGGYCVFLRYNPDSKESDLNVLLKRVKFYLKLGNLDSEGNSIDPYNDDLNDENNNINLNLCNSMDLYGVNNLTPYKKNNIYVDNEDDDETEPITEEEILRTWIDLSFKVEYLFY